MNLGDKAGVPYVEPAPLKVAPIPHPTVTPIPMEEVWPVRVPVPVSR